MSPFSSSSSSADAGSGGGASGSGDAANGNGGSVGPGGGTNACLPALSRCDGAGTCCPGSVCVTKAGTDVPRCVQTCTSRFECGSLCCAEDATTKQMLCADESACPPLECSNVGGSCTQPGPKCCAGLSCVSSSAKEFSGCRTPCKAASDCGTTECCVAYADGTLGFCSDKSACECAAEGATCGGTRHCCSGTACTTFDSTGAFACKPTCTANADCETKCCVSLGGTADSVCLPKTFCP